MWGKRPRHFLRFVSPQISILALKANLKGQNKMFRWLIWGIVRLCRSNMTRDMIKNWKVDFSKNVNFYTFFLSNFCVKIFISFLNLSRLQFSSYINNQHLIWKLWCLTLIWYPSEVTEAINLNSATSWSGRWQSHRKSKVQKLTFFEKSTFQFFIVSRFIFYLQRYTMPQINCLNIYSWLF